MHEDVPIQPWKKNLVFVHVLDNKILRSMEKPLKLRSYDGNKDSDEHIDHVDDHLDYNHADTNVKCKLFMLTLTKSALA